LYITLTTASNINSKLRPQIRVKKDSQLNFIHKPNIMELTHHGQGIMS